MWLMALDTIGSNLDDWQLLIPVAVRKDGVALAQR